MLLSLYCSIKELQR